MPASGEWPWDVNTQSSDEAISKLIQSVRLRLSDALDVPPTSITCGLADEADETVTLWTLTTWPRPAESATTTSKPTAPGPPQPGGYAPPGPTRN